MELSLPSDIFGSDIVPVCICVHGSSLSYCCVLSCLSIVCDDFSAQRTQWASEGPSWGMCHLYKLRISTRCNYYSEDGVFGIIFLSLSVFWWYKHPRKTYFCLWFWHWESRSSAVDLFTGLDHMLYCNSRKQKGNRWGGKRQTQGQLHCIAARGWGN